MYVQNVLDAHSDIQLACSATLGTVGPCCHTDCTILTQYGVALWAGIAQSVQQVATGCTVRGSNPGGSNSFRTLPDRVFPRGKATGTWR